MFASKGTQLAGAAFLALALMGSIAHSDVREGVEAAQRALRQGDGIAAWQAWKKAEDEIWNQLPFTLALATFTQDKANGWGAFDPRSNVFKPGDTIFIYLEPIGFRYVVSGDAANRLYQIRLRIGARLSTEKGEELFSTNNFGMFSTVTRHPNRELYLSLEINIPDNVRPGNYRLTLPVTDMVGQHTASVTLPFTVRKK